MMCDILFLIKSLFLLGATMGISDETELLRLRDQHISIYGEKYVIFIL